MYYDIFELKNIRVFLFRYYVQKAINMAKRKYLQKV